MTRPGRQSAGAVLRSAAGTLWIVSSDAPVLVPGLGSGATTPLDRIKQRVDPGDDVQSEDRIQPDHESPGGFVPGGSAPSGLALTRSPAWPYATHAYVGDSPHALGRERPRFATPARPAYATPLWLAVWRPMLSRLVVRRRHRDPRVCNAHTQRGRNQFAPPCRQVVRRCQTSNGGRFIHFATDPHSRVGGVARVVPSKAAPSGCRGRSAPTAETRCDPRYARPGRARGRV